MRFLIDENLCHDLVATANDAGHEAHHVDWLDLKGTKDPRLMPRIVAEDFTFVTNNAADFRKLFTLEALHAGLVILLPSVRRARQIELFKAVLRDIAVDGDMVNKMIEVWFADDGETIETERRDLAQSEV